MFKGNEILKKHLCAHNMIAIKDSIAENNCQHLLIGQIYI